MLFQCLASQFTQILYKLTRMTPFMSNLFQILLLVYHWIDVFQIVTLKSFGCF